MSEAVGHGAILVMFWYHVREVAEGDDRGEFRHRHRVDDGVGFEPISEHLFVGRGEH